jgi:hypothetical protein
MLGFVSETHKSYKVRGLSVCRVAGSRRAERGCDYTRLLPTIQQARESFLSKCMVLQQMRLAQASYEENLSFQCTSHPANQLKTL